ncbi:hypothetical protein BDV26DRAFT_296404 [Aspergillus bertholletiae]|uniref:MARVEL domain-containing protein n=1 Tax=Aspergillus bertholletiae TaxID=1226010 RepID=A0A5N7AYR0_9EURO|nr:hypothetical protein BDV26DRAFT_296404 [Aspergillus bertholletiae]
MEPIQLGIHVVQSVIAIIILGCSIYGVTIASTTTGFGLAIFTAIATILVAIYILSASFIAKSIYKFWLLVGANCITTIFWIATIGTLASQQYQNHCQYDHGHCYRKRDRSDSHGVHAATIALSVIDGLLSIISIGYSLWAKKNHRTKIPATE